jgi:hypothetical protein
MYTLVTIYELTQHHIPEGLNPDQYSSAPLLVPQEFLLTVENFWITITHLI